MTLALLIGAGVIGARVYRAYRNVQQWSLPAPPSSMLPVAVAAPRIVASSVSAMPTASPTRIVASPTRIVASPTATLEPTAIPSPTALPVAEARTILLLGLDARPGEGLQARSDALMLVRLDPQHNDVALLSMPRDLWVDVPGYGGSKINGAFFYGQRAAPHGGMTLAAQTVGNAFGVPIDHTVVIDFAGFRSLIDALGGITVDVPKELYDPQFPTDDYGYTVAHFLPGPQTMDGAAALMFARTRHPDSDFERIKRQQLVLLGIANRIRERSTFQNLNEADALTAALTPYVHTDMSPSDVLTMLWSLRTVDPTSARRYTVDGALLWETTVGGAYALVPRDGVLPALGRQLLQATTP